MGFRDSVDKWADECRVEIEDEDWCLCFFLRLKKGIWTRGEEKERRKKRAKAKAKTKKKDEADLTVYI